MKQRRLGNTNLVVSEIALGTVELGLDYGITTKGDHFRPSKSDAARLLNETLDLGINFIDTARAYGTSEEVIGEALKHRRKDYLLATKIGAFQIAGMDVQAVSRHIEKSVETSLTLLQTDYVDLLMLHSAPIEIIQRMEMIQGAIDRLRQNGSIRCFGASVYEEVGIPVLERDDVECLQIGYSVLDRRPEEAILPRAEDKGVGVVARSVLLKGVITPRYRDLPDDLASLKSAVTKLESLAHQAGMSLPELAFRYVLSSSVVALCGTARTDEIQSAVEYANRGPLASDLLAQIRQIEVAEPSLLNPGNWRVSEVA
jgi:aryl-alcohol dehydrogenase-like predicted oxidoreductase